MYCIGVDILIINSDTTSKWQTARSVHCTGSDSGHSSYTLDERTVVTLGSLQGLLTHEASRVRVSAAALKYCRTRCRTNMNTQRWCYPSLPFFLLVVFWCVSHLFTSDVMCSDNIKDCVYSQTHCIHTQLCLCLQTLME